MTDTILEIKTSKIIRKNEVLKDISLSVKKVRLSQLSVLQVQEINLPSLY